jgi:hypothetical protein
MQITGTSNIQTTSTGTPQTGNRKTSSFQDYLAAAQNDTTGSTGSTGTAGTGTGTGTGAVQDFLSYMHETPGQRMFDSWLGSQHISKEQFAAMSPAEKQKVMEQFRRELEEKMKGKLDAASTAPSSAS